MYYYKNWRYKLHAPEVFSHKRYIPRVAVRAQVRSQNIQQTVINVPRKPQHKNVPTKSICLKFTKTKYSNSMRITHVAFFLFLMFLIHFVRSFVLHTQVCPRTNQNKHIQHRLYGRRENTVMRVCLREWWGHSIFGLTKMWVRGLTK